MNAPAIRPRLHIVECEGHGRYFEVDDDGAYMGTFETAADVAREFPGRLAYLWTFDDYERECERRIAADPTAWDCSDVEPHPRLVMVREVV